MTLIKKTKNKMKFSGYLKSMVSSKKTTNKEVVFFVLIAFVSLITHKANAQVTFSSSDNIELTHGWDYLKETFSYPCDSSELVIKPYPILEPYKKYIGQQIVIVNNYINFYKRTEYIGVHDKTYYNFNQVKPNNGSYFTIVGVQPLGDPKYSIMSENTSRTNYRYKRPDNEYAGYNIPYNEYPVFLVENTETKDTLLVDLLGKDPLDKYSNAAYLLVGGYIRLKENFLNKEVIYYETSDFSQGYYQSSIQSIWKCIDVLISTGKHYCEQCNDEKIKSENSNYLALQIQNTENPKIVRNLKINCLISAEKLKLSDKIFNWASCTEGSYGFTFKDIFESEMKSRTNAALVEEKKSNQEFTKRKQSLAAKYGATTADKIIAGKFEIGMSKAVCKEIIGYVPAVIEKTETTETWKINYFIGNNSTFLLFYGDKLSKIINR